MKTRLAFLLLLGISPLIRAELVFSGYVAVGETTRFVITEAGSGRTSGWLPIGGRFDGWSIDAFDAGAETLRVSRDGRVQSLPLKKDTTRHLPVASEATRAFVESLAISSATPSSGTREVGLIYVYRGDSYHVHAVGQVVDEKLGLTLHSVTSDPAGALIVFAEKSGAVVARVLPRKR